MAKRPGGVMVQGTEATRSQLIPVITKWNELGKTAQLGPVLFCIVVFFAMATFGYTTTIVYPIVAADGKHYIDPRYWIYTSWFLMMLAVFLTMVSMWFIYRMIGKDKSWYVLLGAAGFSAYYLWLMQVDHDFLWMYEFFHLHLAGGEPDASAPFIQLFIQHFLGTGFFEEIVKALPILGLVVAARYMTPEDTGQDRGRGTAGWHSDRRGFRRRLCHHGNPHPVHAPRPGEYMDHHRACVSRSP